METRLFLIAPIGPLCFIDYSTEVEGLIIMNKIREIAAFDSADKGYEFKLFRKIKDRFIKIDQFFLPRFHRTCIDFFIGTAPMPEYGF